MQIDRLDHLVMTVADIEKTIRFYCDVLGMTEASFGEGRKALAYGNQKINFHQLGKEFEPKAAFSTPGSVDLCFIASTPIEKVITTLKIHQVDIIAGPVEKNGATGKIISVYLRDPDENLIEISNYKK
ncbi:MAG: VOC family protein [Hassallia sp.]